MTNDFFTQKNDPLIKVATELLEKKQKYPVEKLIQELEGIIKTPDAKLVDVANISLNINHDYVAEYFRDVYPYVEDMWEAIMSGRDAKGIKTLAKKAIEDIKEKYPVKGKKYIRQFESIIALPDSKLNSGLKISSRISWDELPGKLPEIYRYVEDMWALADAPTGAKKVKAIAKKALAYVKKKYQ